MDTAEFQKQVWAFFRENGRPFPWRETTDPYAILVSEFMLQQTQTARVVQKYAEWLKRFPCAKTLSEADFSRVLETWNGLGYNRRARYLWEAGKQIAEKGFPSTVSALALLSGVGPYTARAVACFAFGEPTVFIETNIRTVFLWHFFQNPAENGGAKPVADKELLPLIEQTLDTSRPREWYYALMDYGTALKKEHPETNRQSSGYVKQSAFRGSLREARGAVIRFLSKNGAAPLSLIAEAEGIEGERLEKATAALVKEGMVVGEPGGVYHV